MTVVLFGIEFLALTGITLEVKDAGGTYLFFAAGKGTHSHSPSANHEARAQALISSLQESATTDIELTRLALFHRAARLARGLSQVPLEARTPLAHIATDPERLTNVRIASLFLLKRLYGSTLFVATDVGDSQPEWAQLFIRSTQDPTIDRRLRQAFERALRSSVPRAMPREVKPSSW